MPSTIAPLLSDFVKRPAAVKDELSTYAQYDPAGFRREAIDFLRTDGDSSARLYIAQLLHQFHLLVEYLVDPALSRTEEAVAISKTLRELGVAIGSDLERLFTTVVKDKYAGPILIRLMDISTALALDKLVVQFQQPLMAHGDVKVRSKAAIEIGRVTKSLSWVVRSLIESDPRIAANAVESLWNANDDKARNVLTIAARSPHNRLAANGLVGLHRHGWMESVPLLLRMASESDPTRRASALWGIGETGDPRFLPWLRQEYEKAEGAEKPQLLRPMSRIQQQLRAYAGAGEIRVSVFDHAILQDGSRRIDISLWSRGGSLPVLSEAQYAIWENKSLVTDYSVRCVASPPLVIAGFALPHFTSTTDVFGQAVERALAACGALRRPGDPWCVVRYVTEMTDTESPIATHLRKHRGLLMDTELIGQVIADPGPRESAAAGLPACLDRLVDITSSASGPRHVFVLFSEESAAAEGPIRLLARSLRGEAVTLHGFAVEGTANCAALRELCAPRNGTFQAASVEGLSRVMAECYQSIVSRYEIIYRCDPKSDEPAVCDLRIACPQGCGQAVVDFGSPAGNPN